VGLEVFAKLGNGSWLGKYPREMGWVFAKDWLHAWWMGRF